MAGIFLGRGLGDELFAVLALTSLAALVLVRNLERHVPEGANRMTEEPPLVTPGVEAEAAPALA